MDPAFLSATRLSALIRGGDIGCLELLDRHIARTERLDPAINAVVVRDFDRARDRARALDNQRDKSAPLFGVPMTVKESFDVAGLPSTRGHVAAREVKATMSSLAIRRLEAAGAVIFGKTNVPVDLADWQSFNPVYGTTSNPWDVTRTPGGSSGGSAATLAAGFSALEIGSDIGGSIRTPAHYCGVFGHKPSWGLCANYGDPATSRASPTDIAVIGPLARSAADLAVALDVLAGPDPLETGHTTSLPVPRPSGLRGLRVALWDSEPGQVTDRETTARLRDLGAFLEGQGAQVSRTARPGFDATEAYHLYLRLLSAAWAAVISDEAVAEEREVARRLPPDMMTADAIMLRAIDMTHRTWAGLNEQRHRHRRAWSAFFRDWDVLICPAMPSAAIPHRQDGPTWERRITIDGQDIAYNDMLFWPLSIGGCHLPSTVVPLGPAPSGLPIGVQVVGPIHGDRTTIAVAGWLEEAGYGFQAPPSW
jgi:amidase